MMKQTTPPKGCFSDNKCGGQSVRKPCPTAMFLISACFGFFSSRREGGNVVLKLPSLFHLPAACLYHDRQNGSILDRIVVSLQNKEEKTREIQLAHLIIWETPDQ
jgi:hypothetical protein